MAQPCHGHKIWIGGPADGKISHLIYAHPADFPARFRGGKRQGRRAVYEREAGDDAPANAVYRFVGYVTD